MQPQFMALKKSGRKLTAISLSDFYMARIASNTAIDAIIINESQANLMAYGIPSMNSEQIWLGVLNAKAGAANKTIVPILPSEMPDDIDEYINSLLNAGASAIGIPIRFRKTLLKCAKKYPVIPVIDNLNSVRTEWNLKKLIEELSEYERIGCPAVYVVDLPLDIGIAARKMLKIPVFGSGSGILDGQCLSIYDITGLSGDFASPHTKKYMDGHSMTIGAINEYCSDNRYAEIVAA